MNDDPIRSAALQNEGKSVFHPSAGAVGNAATQSPPSGGMAVHYEPNRAAEAPMHEPLTPWDGSRVTH